MIFIPKLTLILSLIGCFTGVSGLVLHFFQFLSEKPKLKIEQISDGDDLYFSIPKDSKYESDFQGFIFIRIFNKSRHPISIADVSLEVPNYKTCHCSKDIDKELKLYFKKNMTSKNVFFIGKSQLKIPTMIKEYGLAEGYLFFPFMQDYKLKQIKGNLVFLTTRGKFETKVQLFRDVCVNSQDLF